MATGPSPVGPIDLRWSMHLLLGRLSWEPLRSQGLTLLGFIPEYVGSALGGIAAEQCSTCSASPKD